MRIALQRDAGSPAPRAVRDECGTMPGRGAYLCLDADGTAPAADCLSLATRRGGIARALRAHAPLDPKLVESVGR